MRSMFIMLPIFGINLFFSICSIVGYEYSGSENSSIYKIYIGLIFIITIAFSIYQVMIKKIIRTRKQILTVFFPFIITAIFLFNTVLGINDGLSFKNFIYFIIFSVPAIYIGLYTALENNILKIYKNMDLLMLIFSTSIIITTLNALLSGNKFDSIGGETYQFASYLSAFAFGINLFYLIFGKKEYRYKFTSSKKYNLLCSLLLIFQTLGVLITGGRGGMILIFIYVLYVTIAVFKDKNYKKIIKYLLVILSFIIFLNVILPDLMESENFKNSINRVFSYISSDGFDWTKTNRDYVYAEALLYINQKILFGYGLFNWGGNNYPHNIILEILLNGGIVYLIVGSTFLFYIIFRLVKIIQYCKEIRIISIILLFPLLMLMFSGTYTTNSIFWFCLSFLYNYKFSKNNFKTVRKII